DAVEAGLAWVEALKRTDGPTALLLTRQNVPVVADEESAAVDRGGYVIKKEGGASIDAVIVAAGSEVALAIDAANALEGEGKSVRVVSMPNRERFLRQSQEYQESVLAAGVPTLVVEAGVGAGWRSIA